MNPHRGEQKGAREVSRRRLAFQHASGERPTGVFARWAPVFMAGTPPPRAARSKTLRRTRSFGGRVESRLLRSP